MLCYAPNRSTTNSSRPHNDALSVKSGCTHWRGSWMLRHFSRSAPCHCPRYCTTNIDITRRGVLHGGYYACRIAPGCTALIRGQLAGRFNVANSSEATVLRSTEGSTLYCIDGAMSQLSSPVWPHIIACHLNAPQFSRTLWQEKTKVL
jgi:hypothetical protein